MANFNMYPGINYVVGINPNSVITPGVRTIDTTCGVASFSEAKDMGAMRQLVKSLVKKITK